MNTYNVIGESLTLKRLLVEVPDVELEEKFASNDWDVRVPDESVDKLVEWCETHNVEVRLV